MADYDVIVIGAGPAGYVLAIRAAANGLKCLLVERDQAGGTCLNRGCIPTKALIHAASLYSEFRSAEKFGITGAPGADYAKINSRKDETVARLRAGTERLIGEKVTAYVKGQASLIDPHTVSVAGKEYTGAKIVLATGAKAFLPPIEGIGSRRVLTSDELLDIAGHPLEHLIIIGGGVIGMEFAGIYLSLGKKVTVVEALERILPGADPEVSANLSLLMKRRGAAIRTGTRVTKVTETGILTDQGTIDGDVILCAVGRRPLIDEAERLGIATEHGRILVNERFETNVPGVYAIGDAASTIQLAHYASASGIWLADHLAGRKPQIDLAAVPSCVYTDPEIAWVGLGEQQLRERQLRYQVGKYPMLGNPRSLIADAPRGFIKIFSDDAGYILGAVLMCERASDLVSELTLALSKHLRVADIASLIYPHPSFSEGIREAAEDTAKQAIHLIYR